MYMPWQFYFYQYFDALCQAHIVVLGFLVSLSSLHHMPSISFFTKRECKLGLGLPGSGLYFPMICMPGSKRRGTRSTSRRLV